MEHLWQIFLAVGILLCIAEVFLPSFIMLPMGLGFLVTAVFAFFNSSLASNLVVLAITEIVVFVVLRRFFPAWSKTPRASNIEAMIGSVCVVVETIKSGQSGTVKLYGDTWAASSAEQRDLPAGTQVLIREVHGNKLVVSSLS